MCIKRQIQEFYNSIIHKGKQKKQTQSICPSKVKWINYGKFIYGNTLQQ